jgi:hypothetical protein
MSGVELGREQLQALMMRLHRVPAEKRIAMLGRLKHLQRLEWPPGANPGKGKRVRYDPEQIFQLALALELIQLGTTPERAVNTLCYHIKTVWVAAAEASKSAVSGVGDPIFLLFDPASLSTALGGDEVSVNVAPMISSYLDDVTKLLKGLGSKEVPRISIVNISALIDRIETELGRLGLGSESSFSEGLLKKAAPRAEIVDLIDQYK